VAPQHAAAGVKIVDADANVGYFMMASGLVGPEGDGVPAAGSAGDDEERGDSESNVRRAQAPASV
jgi:hypothetical protein